MNDRKKFNEISIRSIFYSLTRSLAHSLIFMAYTRKWTI